MALLLTTEPTGELLTVADAKRHLRLFDNSLDDEVTSLIRAARDYAERYTQRTMRGATLRTLKLCEWWTTALKLPWPPLLASPAPAVTYYDADNVSQTLATTEYAVELSTDGGGRLVWVANATIPTVYDRTDAISVAFSTGYADAAAIPPVALQAMKIKLTELWAAGTESEMKAAKECADRLLGHVDWTGYA
jgi:uncharacterized phiE125 gp8 family phage protein